MTATKFDDLMQRVRRALESSTGHPAVVSRPRVLKDAPRSLVLRCSVESGAGIRSIIIRQIDNDPARGFTDWAGLEFLTRVPEARGLAPRFLTGDVDDGWFATEDLGRGATLQDILDAADPGKARDALRSLASTMARLHTATLTKSDEFEVIRKGLPSAAGLGRRREAETWLAAFETIAAWFAAVDLAPPAGLKESMADIAHAFRDPAEFSGFTHGDPAPTNNHFLRGRVRLLDFEYSAFRHVLYDITAWNILCPLPMAWVQDMRKRFLEELEKDLPAARNEARFAEAWSFLCAYRGLAILTWLPPDILERNRPWAHNWNMREALLVALSRTRDVSVGIATLGPVLEAADALVETLRSRWPEYGEAETLLPRWRATSAFRGHDGPRPP